MADELFKKNSIASLRGMLSKIQTEISQKKSLLRTCVGLRYRDVIQAADSISNMEVLVKEFQELLENNDSLKRSIEAMPLKSKNQLESREIHKMQAAIHLKLLIWIPEEVYKTTEYLKAAGLIAIGEWAYTMIMEYEKTSEYTFTVAKRQKSLLEILKNKLLRDAFSSLKDIQGLKQETIVAILLLSDSSHLLLLQTIFDYSRKELDTQAQAEGDILVWIEDRTKYILSFLTKVLDLFQLKDGKTGFDDKLEHFIRDLSNLDHFKELLNEWFSDKIDVERLIPLITTPFSLKERRITPLKTQDLSNLVPEWISFVFEDTKRIVQSLLEKIQSGVELARIRDGVLFLTAQFEFEGKSKELGVLWSLFKSNVLKKEISFWTDLYQDSFSSRFNALMLVSFGTIFNNFTLTLDMALDKMKTSDSIAHNVASFYWREKSALGKTMPKKVHHTPEAKALIEEFEKKINEALNDFKPMLKYPSSIPGKSNISIPIESLYGLERISEENLKLVKSAFENCSKTFVNNCMGLILRENIGDDNVHKFIFVGRLCKGLADYVSTLAWKVPESHKSNGVKDVDFTGSMSENEAHIFFLNTYRSVHEILIQYVVSNFELSLLNSFEAEEWNMEDIWTNLWIDHVVEPIDGQEKGEILKVPVYATHHLMKKLFQVSGNIHRMGAHDLDRPLLILFSFLMGKSLCKIYGHILTKQMSDKVKLQLLFDIYFLTRVFEGTWSVDSSEFSEKLELKKIFQSLLGSYKEKIDPIDLAVYDNHLQSYSDRFFYKQIVLLSPLMIFSSRPIDSRKQFSENESHHVLSLAPSIPRFSLLPLGLPSNMKQRNSVSERRLSIEFYRRSSELKTRKKPFVTLTLNSTNAKTNTESVYTLGNRQATELLKNASSYITGVLSTSRKP